MFSFVFLRVGDLIVRFTKYIIRKKPSNRGVRHVQPQSIIGAFGEGSSVLKLNHGELIWVYVFGVPADTISWLDTDGAYTSKLDDDIAVLLIRGENAPSELTLCVLETCDEKWIQNLLQEVLCDPHDVKHNDNSPPYCRRVKYYSRTHTGIDTWTHKTYTVHFSSFGITKLAKGYS